MCVKNNKKKEVLAKKFKNVNKNRHRKKEIFINNARHTFKKPIRRECKFEDNVTVISQLMKMHL